MHTNQIISQLFANNFKQWENTQGDTLLYYIDCKKKSHNTTRFSETQISTTFCSQLLTKRSAPSRKFRLHILIKNEQNNYPFKLFCSLKTIEPLYEWASIGCLKGLP